MDHIHDDNSDSDPDDVAEFYHDDLSENRNADYSMIPLSVARQTHLLGARHFQLLSTKGFFPKVVAPILLLTAVVFAVLDHDWLKKNLENISGA